MKFIGSFFYITLFVLIIQSCDITQPALSDVDSQVEFIVREDYENYETKEELKLFLDLFTTKEYGCYDFGLATTTSIIEDKISVNIFSLIIPEVCATAIGPARARILLDIPDGKYDLEIQLNGYKNEFEMSFFNKQISIKEKSVHNTYPVSNPTFF